MADYTNDADLVSADLPVEDISLEKLMPEQSWDVELVAKIYEHIPIPFYEKTTLTGDLITPVAANLGRLKADALAWDTCGENLFRVANNLDHNARVLTTHHWTGSAADGFRGALTNGWIGPLAVGGGICKLIGKGLMMVFEGCLDAVTALATKLIPAIVRLLEKLALKAVPGVGWVWELVESVANREIPYKDEIDKVVGMIEVVREVHAAIEKLTKLINEYKAAFMAVVDLLATLRDLDTSVGPSGASVVGVINDMRDIGTAAEAYSGEIETDENGRYVRNEDGTFKVRKSEHQDTIDDIKSATRSVTETLNRAERDVRKKSF